MHCPSAFSVSLAPFPSFSFLLPNCASDHVTPWLTPSTVVPFHGCVPFRVCPWAFARSLIGHPSGAPAHVLVCPAWLDMRVCRHRFSPQAGLPDCSASLPSILHLLTFFFLQSFFGLWLSCVSLYYLVHFLYIFYLPLPKSPGEWGPYLLKGDICLWFRRKWSNL